MNLFTCKKHETLTQKKGREAASKSLIEQRLGFKCGDKAYAILEYKRIFEEEPVFEGGVIVEFGDPYSFEPNNTSVACIHCICGCVIRINVGWLKKQQKESFTEPGSEA